MDRHQVKGIDIFPLSLSWMECATILLINFIIFIFRGSYHTVSLIIHSHTILIITMEDKSIHKKGNNSQNISLIRTYQVWTQEGNVSRIENKRYRLL